MPSMLMGNPSVVTNSPEDFAKNLTGQAIVRVGSNFVATFIELPDGLTMIQNLSL